MTPAKPVHSHGPIIHTHNTVRLHLRQRDKHSRKNRRAHEAFSGIADLSNQHQDQQTWQRTMRPHAPPAQSNHTYTRFRRTGIGAIHEATRQDSPACQISLIPASSQTPASAMRWRRPADRPRRLPVKLTHVHPQDSYDPRLTGLLKATENRKFRILHPHYPLPSENDDYRVASC